MIEGLSNPFVPVSGRGWRGIVARVQTQVIDGYFKIERMGFLLCLSIVQYF